MDWIDRGLVIGLRKHGEASVILEVMTPGHGRHFGVVRAGRSRALQPSLQQGNRLRLAWRARLEEHIGAFTIEPDELRAGRLMSSQMALQGLHWLANLLRLLPERDPHAALFEMADAMAAHLDDPFVAPELLVRFELALLTELGFGLDLNACALTGVRENLAYVSPKSGRAVEAAAAAPWVERLLPLPAFLCAAFGERRATPDEIEAGFRLTLHFLRRDLLDPRGLEGALDCRAIFTKQARMKAQPGSR